MTGSRRLRVGATTDPDGLLCGQPAGAGLRLQRIHDLGSRQPAQHAVATDRPHLIGARGADLADGAPGLCRHDAIRRDLDDVGAGHTGAESERHEGTGCTDDDAIAGGDVLVLAMSGHGGCSFPAEAVVGEKHGCALFAANTTSLFRNCGVLLFRCVLIRELYRMSVRSKHCLLIYLSKAVNDRSVSDYILTSTEG